MENNTFKKEEENDKSPLDSLAGSREKIQELAREQAKSMSSSEKVASLFEVAMNVDISVYEMLVGIYSLIGFLHQEKQIDKKNLEALVEVSTKLHEELINLNK